MSKPDPREHFEKNRSNFVKEYTGSARDIVGNKSFRKMDERARKELKESAQSMTGAKSTGQVTVWRSKDGKERIVLKGNK